MLLFATFLYATSLICQISAATYSFYVFKKSPAAWKYSWLAFSIALGLMIGRRISPLEHILTDGDVNISDALLSVPISGMLLVGVIGAHRILKQELEKINFINSLTLLDPLTGALNRTEIMHKISQEISHMRRTGEHFALLELDIDHFKRVNDTYGHDAGDQVLQGLVRTIKASLRASDEIGRIGGEEFLILLPHTSESLSMAMAERMRDLVAKTALDVNDASPLQITVSIGSSSSNTKNILSLHTLDAMNHLIKEADNAMYQAKNNGRNCCCQSPH